VEKEKDTYDNPPLQIMVWDFPQGAPIDGKHGKDGNDDAKRACEEDF